MILNNVIKIIDHSENRLLKHNVSGELAQVYRMLVKELYAFYRILCKCQKVPFFLKRSFGDIVLSDFKNCVKK